ncbi:MAG: hypothetical protein KF746_20825 [Chitinophagaceae bacterium]|nr:hypothetical protein [Chitinophagaceae bacterium]
MKRALFLILTLLPVLFISCQKEVSTELPEEPQLPDDDTPDPIQIRLPERIVTVYGAEDSVVLRYFYDTNGKLVKATDESFGNDLINVSYYNLELRLYRNSGGIIERLVPVLFHYVGFDLQRTDSSLYHVFYDPLNKQYTHSIHYIILDPFIHPSEVTRDSIAYGYNNKGQLDLQQVFRKDLSANNYFEAERLEYTYNNAGNIIKVSGNENYDNTGDPLTDFFIDEYDNKPNPLNFGYECLLMGIDRYGWPSVNNYIKVRYEDYQEEYIYTYNEFDLPETMVLRGDGVQRAVTRFYYR